MSDESATRSDGLPEPGSSAPPLRAAAGPRRVRHNSHWGRFEAHIEDGRVVAALPAPDDPEPAAMLASIPEGVHSRARILRPAIRAGWLDGGPGAGDRCGDEEFVEVDWPVALDLVAEELARVRDTFGYASIFGGSYGWASAGRFHHAKTQVNRFLGLFGGYTAQIGNYSYAAASVILPHVIGRSEPAAPEVTSWDVISEHTELWLMFGGASLRTAQVESGGLRKHIAGDWLRRVKDSGTHLVNISPLRDDVPDFAGASWLPIRPGTDTALMLALAHCIVAAGAHDENFLARYCVGWERVRDYLSGQADGVVKDAEWGSNICEIPAADIRTLAARMARNRTLVTCTYSLQRAEHGEQPYWAAITLAAVLGQIGLPGGGFGFAYGDSALVGQPKYQFPAPALASGRNPIGSAIPVARIADMLLNPGGPYDFNGHQFTYPDVRLVYWAGGNPFHHHQDLNRLVDAWRRPETIIVHEPWWTATARRADIVLPATTTLERNDIAASSKDTAITAMYRAIDPVGEARDDYLIFTELAKRLGFEQKFTEGRDEAAWLEHLYESSRRVAATVGVELPPFGQFWADGEVEVPETRSQVMLKNFRDDPHAHPLDTPSGRIELHSATIESFGYEDCPGQATWLPPSEYLGNAAPNLLHLISNQPGTRLHSQLDMAGASRAAKIAGREPCRMNPSDASARGLTDGAVVEIANERGRCLAGLQISEAVRPGVIQLSTGAWFDPVDSATGGSLDSHGNPNVLTADRGTSRLAQGPSAHSTLVQVRAYPHEPPPVRAFEPPTLQKRPSHLASPTTPPRTSRKREI